MKSRVMEDRFRKTLLLELLQWMWLILDRVEDRLRQTLLFGTTPVDIVNFRSTFRPPVEISYRTDEDDVDRMLPHSASFYGHPHDVVVNVRPDDGADHEAVAAGGLPSLLSNYQFYIGTPDLKLSQAHRIVRDPPSHDHQQEFTNTGTSPELR